MEKAYAVNMTDFYDDMYTLCICKTKTDAEEMVLAFAEQNAVDNFNEMLSNSKATPEGIFEGWREDADPAHSFDYYLLTEWLYHYQYFDCIEVPMF